MSCFVNIKDTQKIEGNGQYSFSLLDEKNGCKAGCSTGISVYYLNEYSMPGIHEDQEGFVVMEGTGWAKVGDEEFRIEPETSFIAPAGVAHTLKKDIDSEPIKVFWFHASI